jgi:hypothetical protein
MTLSQHMPEVTDESHEILVKISCLCTEIQTCNLPSIKPKRTNYTVTFGIQTGIVHATTLETKMILVCNRL